MKIKLVAGILLLFTYILSFAQSAGQEDYAAVNGAMTYRMVGKEVDNPEREWSFTPKQTTVIGVPFTPTPVQVTFDGAIYTRDSELFFFYGKEDKPLCATQKTFFQGWIPIVEYDWLEDGIQYKIEMFGHSLKDEGCINSVQFVKVKMKNTTSVKKQVYFGGAIRASGLDHRMGEPKFSAESVYEFEGNNFMRDGDLVYSFSDKPVCYAVKNVSYSNSYSSKEYEIKKNTAVGIVKYTQTLNSNEEYEIIFKYPRVAVKQNETTFLNKLQSGEYNDYRNRCVDFWTRLIEGNGYFNIPEKRVNDSYKAGLVHLVLSTRTHQNGVKRQGSGLPYDGIFFNDFIDMRLIYDVAGLHEYVELNYDWLNNAVNEEGLFVDSSVSHNREIMTSHGQALYSICNHFMYKDDKKLAKEMLNTVRKAVGLIAHDHKKQPNGLVRPSIPFDAEMIEGYYTSHNLWCLLGLRSAIIYAEYLGLNNDAKQWRELELSYRNSLLVAIEQSTAEDGYVPTGLYEFKKGKECGWALFRTDQDWENMLLVYPTELLFPTDKKVSGTLSHIRKKRFREGITTYRDGQHLHQYATTNLTNQHIAMNDQETALYDMYHILLHNGSTHEGFENMVEPWGDRDPEPIPGPHAWAAAKTSLLIRNCLIREYGGNAGLDMKERSLYLFSVISPVWEKPGESIDIVNAKTEFGIVNASMKFKKESVRITMNGNFIRKPKNIYIAIPHFKKISKITTDNRIKITIENGYIVCDPDIKTLDIEWTDKTPIHYLHTILNNYRKEPGVSWVLPSVDYYAKSPKDIISNDSELVIVPGTKEGFLTDAETILPAEKINFELVRKAYLMEYNRRRTQYLNAAKPLLRIEAPAFE